ncbi:hypothetical protein FA95DRAFT_1602388 [Auriscalpium vulgare]|uniref:Uncharacterized protein n=1 Tax=Auriscalpium vulgare TaxID=40419 RepID=A0ACB8S6U5_9AGAM|nr:hypothetical protein FA95DRAFT_1602388 [Auriscalpium vulgare]
MATTVQQRAPQEGPSSPLANVPMGALASTMHGAFPRNSIPISDLEFRDDRYPTLSPRHLATQPNGDRPAFRQSSYPDGLRQHTNASAPPPGTQLPRPPDASAPIRAYTYPDDTYGARRTQETVLPGQKHQLDEPAYQAGRPDFQASSSPPRNDSPTPHTLPSASPPRVNEQYSAAELFPTSPASSGDANKPQPAANSRSLQESPVAQRGPWPAPMDETQQEPYPNRPPAPQTPTLSPSPAMMTGPQSYTSPITIPVSPNLRAPAQQPTYITPAASPNAMNPIFSTPAQGEEVCVECAMRDQDMVDVDVTSHGIWARESDVAYEELLRRELEEEDLGVPATDDRPRARGGRLSEPNMKLWLSLNPKEASSKRNALEAYIKAQRSLLEAEALAHARAMQESRQIDDRMRDAYSQLRRSAYELGTSATPTDDTGGVRIKAIRSSTVPNASVMSAHGREVTLLENGMIVEHVDVRREEREERERRRREDKRARARKSSRGSAIDVASMYSSTSPLPHTDSGFHLSASPNRYSTSRPMSVLTAPMDYPSRGMPHAQSSASVEAQSMISGSASPNRRTRFFGLRNFSTGFRSSDSLAPSGFSGSMVDMHVALQRENARMAQEPVPSAVVQPTISGWRNSTALVPQRGMEEATDDKPKKKKKGLAKIWKLVTGSSRGDSAAAANNGSQSRSLDRGAHDDDYPLAPPPPLSYLVGRSTGEHGGNALRHVSTPSLPSSVSPNYALSSAGVSPPTAPSSLLPSPTSSRPLGAPEDRDGRKTSANMDPDAEYPSPVEEEPSQLPPQRNVHPVTSEPDMRRSSQIMSSPAPPMPRLPSGVQGRPESMAQERPESMAWREKSLPPLPGEIAARYQTHPSLEPRPRTLFSYDMRVGEQSMPLAAPKAQFLQPEQRRQSFGGISTRPNLLIQTLPSRHPQYATDSFVGGSSEKRPRPADQFGTLRGTLAQDGAAQNQMALAPPTTTPSKRKSRFGLATLLGRKVPPAEREGALLGVEFPAARSSGSEAMHEAMMNDVGSSQGSGHAFPRLSMSARKNIEELVDQSPDFVAYRYPSNEHNLDLLR